MEVGREDEEGGVGWIALRGRVGERLGRAGDGEDAEVNNMRDAFMTASRR